MAGMLPGVECARRRRFHQSGGLSDSPSAAVIGLTRRSSFCLYASNHETHHTSVSSQQRSISTQTYQDDKLGVVVREARERLDGRLRSQRKSQPKRHKSKEITKCVVDQGELQSEVYGAKKRFSWGKLSWKAMEQDECAICLERFKAGESLVHPPCAHRFHSRCLVPWLQNNAHCPCCRIGILP
ncbi:zinc finger family protein [Hibiscus syriacus]|uniref:Zinc finger family protein n=1 Tax=Hibiscus syriacus TaxID=106335 RepID=A0A6A2XKW7_HIBSY|nr:RING-H2 finger protein ATL16-like [Hibiscus syriacus]KAE8654494.1 zinc finger family protein [Hibiscus syriacus]